MYRVTYGWMQHEDFRSWEDALAFWSRMPGAGIPQNLDRCDGAPDARNPTGLTETEREAVGL